MSLTEWGQSAQSYFVVALTSMVLFGVFMALFAHVSPLQLYAEMYRGGFGTRFSWQNTLTRAAPLILTALCTALPARLADVTILLPTRTSLPQLEDQSIAAARSAQKKGWRWVGEMEEIAQTFAAAGLPDGFHRAAAEIYRRGPS